MWSSSAYAVTAVLGILQQQWWVDRLGHRRYVAGCMLMFSFGAIAAALADTSLEPRSRAAFRVISSAR